MKVEIIETNGVTYPKGFKASGIHCGLRKNAEKKDLACIIADVPCNAAAIYTTNKVYGAPITVTRENISNGIAQGVICNSGNANTCNSDGVEKARQMCKLFAQSANLDATDVIVASTGVIGQPLPLEPIADGMAQLTASASYGTEGGTDAALAIMTTDLKRKECAAQVTLSDGAVIKIGAMSKGSGMIEPNMATMLAFVTTDASIDSALLQKALKTAADKTFNMISVDGDTSTNDMLCVMASGLSNNKKITEENDDYTLFLDALTAICENLAKRMASDGEGATKLLECTVKNAKCDAKVLAKSVIKSSLVKTAMFGADANWGRILCALGYAGVDIDTSKIDVSFISDKGKIDVCQNGGGIDFSEERAKEILLEDKITILVDMKDGEDCATAWGCDLSYEYVRINGDYRS